MKIKKNAAIILFLSIIISLSLFLLVEDSVERSVYIIVVSTITIFCIVYICNKITSPVSLLIVSSFVFLGSRPFLSFFTNYDYRIADWFLSGYMGESVVDANYAISLMYYGYSIGLVISSNTFIKRNSSLNPYIHSPSEKILFFLCGIGVVGMILKGLYFFNYINSNSYVDIYSNNIQVPIGYDFLSYLFYCAFFLICAFYPKYRTNLLFLAFAVSVAAFSALKGSRSEFITFFLTVICIYYNENKIRNINLAARMFVIFIIIFVLSEFVSMWRSGGSFVELIEGNNPAINFLYGMGVSYISIYQSIQLGMTSFFYDASYLFSQIILTFSSIFRINLDLPEFSYSHLASLTANPQLYEQGYGLGGSYLSESYLALGLVGCLIIPCMVSIVINSFEKYTKNNQYIYFLYYSCLPPLLFIPRETLLYFFPYALKSIIIIFSIMLYSQSRYRVK
ncbi:TPA: O-antigen polysaccharide polymerase Wzy [Salmonella enterica]|nr:O-antigen polysaccharide polymerase Wzy [Salmonella enterica]